MVVDAVEDVGEIGLRGLCGLLAHGTPCATGRGAHHRADGTGVWGRVSGLFLVGYGLFRFIAEFFREPDAHLGLLSLGKGALATVSDFGTINTTVIASVPEPTTYALMGLGLVGIAAVARRRAA